MKKYVTRSILVSGVRVDIYDFGYKKYMYPDFNGDAEFEVTKKGYKKLRKYIRTILWMDSMINNL